MEKRIGISRRQFLTGTGAAIGGLAAGTVLGYNSVAQAATAAASFPFPGTAFLSQNHAATGKTYQTLILENACKAYHTMAGCCMGGFYGIAETMRMYYATDGAGNDAAKKAMWDEIPNDMFKWGLGGGMNWGTVCGALNGAIFCINLVARAGGAAHGKLIDNAMHWYQKTNLPSTDNNAALDAIYADAGNVWAAAVQSDGKAYKDITFVDSGAAGNTRNRSTAKSPLCHASVSKWIGAQGAALESASEVDDTSKKARCARLTAETALYVATALAAWVTAGADNAVAPAAVARGEVYNNICFDCHSGTGTTTNGAISPAQPQRDDEQGKMDCLECHDYNTGKGDASGLSDNKSNKAPDCNRSLTVTI